VVRCRMVKFRGRANRIYWCIGFERRGFKNDSEYFGMSNWIDRAVILIILSLKHHFLSFWLTPCGIQSPHYPSTPLIYPIIGRTTLSLSVTSLQGPHLSYLAIIHSMINFHSFAFTVNFIALFSFQHNCQAKPCTLLNPDLWRLQICIYGT